MLYIGKAQERFASFRVIKKISVHTGQPYPWLNRSSVMCNHYYFYLVDEDFGPLFIKFSSYFPYTARVCLNGHEYAKRQLAKEGIAFEALDNGVLSCADPARLQQILDELDETKIAALVAKWLARLPDPFAAADHAAGFNPTTVHPASGVLPHPGVRPALVRASPVRGDHPRKPRPGATFQGQPDLRAEDHQTHAGDSFHTRVVTQGVIPSLHVGYKSSKIKQYFKEGRALRTETTINNTHDFRRRT